MHHSSRRSFLKSSGAALATAPLLSHMSLAQNASSDPIMIGIPAALSGAVGVGDHADWINGINLAVEEINGAGGVNGRQIQTSVVDVDILNPESILSSFQTLIGQGVHVLASAFVFIPQPAMDAAAAAGVPYLHGNTQKASLDLFSSDPSKYRNTFQIDVSENWYGTGFIRFLSDLRDSGNWNPKNNRVHIVQEQIAYTQVIAQATRDAIAASGKWEVGAVTDIQFPVQDWAPVIQALKDSDCAAIMIDHWVAAELAAFAQAYTLDPVKGALVYLQYGPSQPEFLDLAGPAADGFVWGSVIGTYADAQGTTFRELYQRKHPGPMGLVYAGAGYDTGHLLARAWAEAVPEEFDKVGDFLRKARYRGVSGVYRFDNDTQSATSYPNQTDDPEGGQAHLIFQIQEDANRIIWPKPFDEVAFRPVPWA